jgi:hypothetical protein
MAGKLKGEILAQTPRGSLLLSVSMSFDTSSLSPMRVEVMAVADSTTCRPRRTSPLASARVLPCSRVMAAAISGVWARIKCWSLVCQLVDPG